MLSPMFAILILAASDSPPATAAGGSEAKKSGRKVCEVVKVTGSRLGKQRVCKIVKDEEANPQEPRADADRARSPVGTSAE